MKTNTTVKTIVFFLFAGLFLMQDKLQDWFAPFQYFDEAVGLLMFPMVLIRWRQKRLPFSADRENLLFGAGLLVFWLFGWAGHLVYQYQPLSNALKDFYVNNKFFLALGASFLFFDDPQLDFAEMKKKIWPVLNAVVIVLFALSLGLNVGLIVGLVYVIMKKRNTYDNTPLISYDIDDDIDF